MNPAPSNRSTSAHGLQLHSPAPMPSGTPLTLSTSTTAADAFATTPTISTAVNSTPSNDPNLRRQPTPLPARVPVETTKISKTQDSNNPTWKMLNQYRVIRLLGRGTHGTVKYGEDMSKEDPNAPDYAVAIKIIKRMPNRRKLPRADGRDRTNTALTRIRYEVAVMKRCNHDHIVRLIEVIDDPRSQAVFLVMEYLEGGEIKWRGHDGPLLSLEQIRRIIRDVLLGLEYLHYMGIIHRDIKPANMLWTKGRARVKLTDFGVAHFSKPLNPHLGKGDSAYEDDDSHLHKTEGTPAFYAPEQAYNQNGLPVPTFPPGKRPPGVKGDQIYPMTKALDVWAFGVSIYCFLFGKPPYWGLNVYALCKEIIDSEYVIPPYATADTLPVNSDDPNMQQALALMRGMMTKPVYLRMTLSQAKISPWLTGDLEDPAAWLRETNPEAKDSIMISDTEPASALIPKNHATRVQSIMKALGIRKEKEHSRQQRRVDTRSIRGQSQVSLEHSTHRPLPGPRSIYRPSADQPASPIEYYASNSAASSPTGLSHFGESYFGRAANIISNSKPVKRVVSSFFRRNKKSTSAEAIMATPAPITPITRATRDVSASSSPPLATNFPQRPPLVPTTDDRDFEPLLITYSSEEPDDDEEGDVPLLGFGGYETYNLGSGEASPPSEASRSFPVLANMSGRRLSTTTSDPLEPPQRVYSPRYAQHTHETRDEFTTDTITSTPSSPKNETVYIMGVSSAPAPLSQTGTHIMRGRALSGVTSDGDSDDEDDEPTTLQMNVHRNRVRQ